MRRDIDLSVNVTGTDLANVNLNYTTGYGKLNVDQNGARATLQREEGNLGYHTANFHIHAPSEHTIDGEIFDMELHNVFQLSSSVAPNYMVIGILFKLDDDAPDIDLLTDLSLGALDRTADAYNAISSVRYKDFIEWTNGKAKYNYQGSLTTPTCDEVVTWMLVKEVRKINAKQLAEITDLFEDYDTFAGGQGNNRAVQPLGNRQVFLTRADDGKSHPIFLEMIDHSFSF